MSIKISLSQAGLRRLAFAALLAQACPAAASELQKPLLPPGGLDVLPPNSLFAFAVGGLDRTQAFSRAVPVAGRSFTNALRVTLAMKAPESNATQLTIRNNADIAKEDVLLAAFHIRGVSHNEPDPARIEFLFEKSTAPWNKSVTAGVDAPSNPDSWKRVLIPFASLADYKPGEAMASLRFAFGPQTIEIADLSVVNYAKSVTLAELFAMIAAQNPLGSVTAAVYRAQTRQTIVGFGGNFAQPRYSSTNAMDPVGQYNMRRLRVAHARIGIPLNHWAQAPGVFCENGPAQAALQQMRIMAERKIPITGSIWEGPSWMLPGKQETSRPLPPELYGDCIEAIARFLLVAREKYGAVVETISFNEPEYGVNFKFTPQQLANFIRAAGPRFAELGLPTRFLTADTATGGHFADFAGPLLDDSTIAPYLGPLAFHCWDALNAMDSAYKAIAELGQRHGKQVWCMEAGHDSDLWRSNNRWHTWENALRTALAYERTLNLSGAAIVDYWTYQDNYPLVDKDGETPFPVWHVIRQFEDAFAPDSRIIETKSSSNALKILSAVGPETNRLAVLFINQHGAGQATLTGLFPHSQFNIITSTEAAQYQNAEKPVAADAKGRLALQLPQRSVVTLTTTHANPAQ